MNKNMRKNFGKKTWLYPMPVFIVATYDELGNPDAMNAAWGGIYDTNQIMLCLSHEHKTTKNIKKNNAFTVSIANAKNVVVSDYLGIVSGNKVTNKIEKANLHVYKSNFVNAPIIEEFPMTLECNLIKFNEDGLVVGEIVNVNADESILDENGNIDYKKLEPITYDSVNNSYIKLGDKVGTAFSDGKKIK